MIRNYDVGDQRCQSVNQSGKITAQVRNSFFFQIIDNILTQKMWASSQLSSPVIAKFLEIWQKCWRRREFCFVVCSLAEMRSGGGEDYKAQPDQTVITIGFIGWMFDSEIRTTNNYNFWSRQTTNMQHNIWCWNTKYYSIKARTCPAGGLTEDRGLVWTEFQVRIRSYHQRHYWLVWNVKVK